MTAADLAERTVDTDEITQLMLAAHRERTGQREVSPERVNTSTWTPAGARKVRRRTFVRLDIDGEAVAVAKIPLSHSDPKLAASSRSCAPSGLRHPWAVRLRSTRWGAGSP
ncbi:hypothetical protein ACFQ10_50845 [Streptomyces indonesiensis]